MTSAARKIYDTYIVKSDMELPKRVKNDIIKVIHSPTGRMTHTLFQTAGAWVYNRIWNSWMREVNSMILWADHDFDNNSVAAQEMELIFNISVINSNPALANENLNLVPHPDDILGNPKLMESFMKFVPQSEFTNACFKFMGASKEIITAPPEAQQKLIGLLVDLFKVIAVDSPELKLILMDIEAQIREYKEAFNPMSFSIPAFVIAQMILTKYYAAWIKKCKDAYKNGGWVPVPRLTFVSNNAIPGTSWIPSVGIQTDVTTKSMPPSSSGTKKKWSLFGKHRSTASYSEASAPTPIAGKKSSSGTLSAPHSPGTKLIVTEPKEEGLPVVKLEVSTGSSAPDDDSESSASSSNSSTEQRRSRSFRVPGSLAKSVPVFRMEVPTICETLTSAHLRRLFYSTFLEFRLGNDEKELWATLSKFQATYLSLTDEDIAQRQKDIRDAAMTILKNNPRIPDHDNLIAVIEKGEYSISSKFFLDAEMKMYEAFHNSYQSFLSNNQWVQS